jgi:uncharacterized protein (DUF58 family)
MSAEVFVEYRVRWRPAGSAPGAVAGQLRGSGDTMRAVVPLREHPDPRRLDLRATARDPWQTLWVRDFHQNSALAVIVLLDMSASMGFVGARDRYADASRLVVALARSAWRNGDAFGFQAAAAAPIASLALPPRVNRGAADWLARRLAAHSPAGDSARGLLAAVRQLPTRRSLVFIVSDFAWPAGAVSDLLGTLVRHEVVPVALWDPHSADVLPTRGLAEVRDIETGQRRFVWFRRSLGARIRQAQAAHESGLRAECRRWGAAPCILRQDFTPLALTRHFLTAHG